jgi:hypothetical protein
LPPSNGNKPDSTLATAVTEVSERVTVLIREEIELAKAEVTVKVKSLTKGIVWFGIAGVLAFFGVIFIPVTIAWLLDDFLVNGAGGLWEGFAIVMGAFLIGAGVCVFLGIRKLKVGSPAPKMAIEEAKKIRETVTTARPNGVATAAASATPSGAAIAPAATEPVIVPGSPAAVETAVAATVLTGTAPAETATAETATAESATAESATAESAADEPGS